MKIKIDFVTNSSSASFAIPLDKITDFQRLMIHNHLDAAKMSMQMEIWNYTPKNSGWSIKEEDGEIKGYTSMDNFDMQSFLLNVLKIPEEDINYKGNG
jgi:hypothetical protein